MRALGGARRFAVRQSQWFVVVALPGVGRPKAKVPKKMPIVTPSTASCAPNGPFAAISATGIGATRYHGFNFILGSPKECAPSCSRAQRERKLTTKVSEGKCL